MFAVVEINNKQHLIKEGDILTIDGTIDNKVLKLDKILFYNEGKNNIIGQPYVKGINIESSVIETGKREKDIVFKFKRKTGYKVTRGHRQNSTLIKITKISKSKSTKPSKETQQIKDIEKASTSTDKQKIATPTNKKEVSDKIEKNTKSNK